MHLCTSVPADPVSHRPAYMRNSPASGWPGRVPPPPPPPQRSLPGANIFGTPMSNRPDARLPLQPHRSPYNLLAPEAGLRGVPDRGDLGALAALPAPAGGAAEAANNPMSHQMPGSAGLGTALSYASSYLMDANLGLDARPQAALDSQLTPLSTAAGKALQADLLKCSPKVFFRSLVTSR